MSSSIFPEGRKHRDVGRHPNSLRQQREEQRSFAHDLYPRSFTSQIWQTQLEHFEKNRRVIAIDPRSQGDSTKTDGDNTPEARARDLREIIQQLALKNVVLVGWSQGVQDVAAYVEQFGTDSIAGFVLVDSPLSSGPAEIKLHPESSE